MPKGRADAEKYLNDFVQDIKKSGARRAHDWAERRAWPERRAVGAAVVCKIVARALSIGILIGIAVASELGRGRRRMAA